MFGMAWHLGCAPQQAQVSIAYSRRTHNNIDLWAPISNRWWRQSVSAQARTVGTVLAYFYCTFPRWLPVWSSTRMTQHAAYDQVNVPDNEPISTTTTTARHTSIMIFFYNKATTSIMHMNEKSSINSKSSLKNTNIKNTQFTNARQQTYVFSKLS